MTWSEKKETAVWEFVRKTVTEGGHDSVHCAVFRIRIGSGFSVWSVTRFRIRIQEGKNHPQKISVSGFTKKNL
jgi:hypothetical protein